MTDSDKISLRALLAQMDVMSARIRQALGESPPDVAANMFDQDMVSDLLSPQDSAIAEPPEKVTAPLPVTEPTPPSTIDHVEGAMDLD